MAFAQALWAVLLELAPWLLLGAAVAGILHVVMPAGFVARHLRGRGGVVRAVLLGVPLPLCSCGVIPAGLGLRKEGASKGASLGFLISTPQTGVDSILVSGSFLGWPFALFKVASAFVLGVFGGLLTSAVTDEAAAAPASVSMDAPRRTLRDGLGHAIEIIDTIWRWLVFGIVASALLTTFVPPGSFSALQGGGGWLAMLAVLAVSVPLYVCATASVPIAAALVAGGMPVGAALVFLMAGPATNVATIGAVRKAFGGRVLAVYLGTIVLGSVGLGWTFDFLLSGAGVPAAHGHEHHGSVMDTVFALVLLAMLLHFALRDLRAALQGRARAGTAAPSIELGVEGLTCDGCVRKLSERLRQTEGVEGVEVIREPAGLAVVQGSAGADALRAVIRDAGFKPV